MQIRIVVEIDRVITLARPETGTFKLVVTPTEKFAALDEVEKAEWLKALSLEKGFYYGRDAEMHFRAADDLSQFFTIGIESQEWEYNGGECSILEEEYDNSARRK